MKCSNLGNKNEVKLSHTIVFVVFKEVFDFKIDRDGSEDTWKMWFVYSSVIIKILMSQQHAPQIENYGADIHYNKSPKQVSQRIF